MNKKLIVEGWLDIDYEDTALYKNKDFIGSIYYANRLNSILEQFNGKKIKITIEEVEEFGVAVDSFNQT